jgi:hypothetical protein
MWKQNREGRENTWNCWSCQVVEISWPITHNNAEGKQKVTKKHITNNEAHEVKGLMGIKRKNFDKTRKRKVQVNPNPKPNNFWNWTWEKCIDGYQVYKLEMFCSILRYEFKGKSSTSTYFQFHYISGFNMLHSILGGIYKSESLFNDFFLPS